MIRMGDSNEFKCSLSQIFTKQVGVSVFGNDVMDMSSSSNDSGPYSFKIVLIMQLCVLFA